MMDNLQELKILIDKQPYLKEKYEKSYLNLLEERNNYSGKQENDFVYHIRPSIQSNYDYYKKAYNDNGQRILDLSKILGLSIDYKTCLPDLTESTIKPYGLSETEKYKIEMSLTGNNSPIGLM